MTQSSEPTQADECNGYRVGDRVARYMGIAGGFWFGEVVGCWSNGRVSVAFGEVWRDAQGALRYDLACGFDCDEYLALVPTGETERAEFLVQIAAIRDSTADINAMLDKPCFPAGYFGRASGGMRRGDDELVRRVDAVDAVEGNEVESET